MQYNGSLSPPINPTTETDTHTHTHTLENEGKGRACVFDSSIAVRMIFCWAVAKDRCAVMHNAVSENSVSRGSEKKLFAIPHNETHNGLFYYHYYFFAVVLCTPLRVCTFPQYVCVCVRFIVAISSELPSPDWWTHPVFPVLPYRGWSILNSVAKPAYPSASAVPVISASACLPPSFSHYQVSIKTWGLISSLFSSHIFLFLFLFVY